MSEVKLQLEIQFLDKTICMQRPAPELPPCVTWHREMWVTFFDGSAYCVEAVYVNQSGNVTVVVEEIYRDNYNEQALTKYIERGWCVINPAETT